MSDLTLEDINYPRNIFKELIDEESPYSFYLHQWVPYQTEANRKRLKMNHDVKNFNGDIEYNVWPNGSHCGTFKDEDVEFIRLSRREKDE